MAGSEIVNFMCRDYEGFAFRLRSGEIGACEELLAPMDVPEADYKAMEYNLGRFIIIRDERDCRRAMDLDDGSVKWHVAQDMCDPAAIEICSGTQDADHYFSCVNDHMRNDLNYIGKRTDINLELQYLWSLNDTDQQLMGFGGGVTGFEMLGLSGTTGSRFRRDSLRLNAGALVLFDLGPDKLDDGKISQCDRASLGGLEAFATFGVTYGISLVGSEKGRGIIFETSAKAGAGTTVDFMANVGLKFVFGGITALRAGVAFHYLAYGIAKPEDNNLYNREVPFAVGPYFTFGPSFY